MRPKELKDYNILLTARCTPALHVRTISPDIGMCTAISSLITSNGVVATGISMCANITVLAAEPLRFALLPLIRSDLNKLLFVRGSLSSLQGISTETHISTNSTNGLWRI
jgi:hypothetical protein